MIVKDFSDSAGIVTLPEGVTLAVAASLAESKLKPVTSALSEAIVYSFAKGAVLVSPLSLKLFKFATLFFLRVILTVLW